MQSTPNQPSRWTHWLAVVTALATLLLIFVGGVVTNTGSALAVPDWPTTFGHNMFLYPWSQMVGGILYEHSHRLIGSVVGMLTVALALALWRTEPRPWVRMLGWAAVVAVIVQGVLGGLRVVLLEHGLAIIHGCVAQAFFALMVSLAVITSPGWHGALQRGPLADATRLRMLALVAVSLVYLQLVFGALLTHTGNRLDAHVLCAGLVTLCVGALAGRVLRLGREHAELRRPAAWLMVLLLLQLSLGLGAYLWRFTAASQSIPVAVGLVVVTTHRLTGAALWATAMVLSLRILRRATVTQTAQHAGSRPLSPAVSSPAGGEVLA